MEFGFGDILQLLGALGLFLFGMKVMSDAITYSLQQNYCIAQGITIDS